MLEIFSQVRETDIQLNEITAALHELKKYDVLVGIPDDAAGRPSDSGPVSNAELLYIHTNGSPINGIPPRPVLEPAIEDGKDTTADLLKAAADAALAGNKAGIEPALEKAGMHGQNIARKWFANPANGWVPNSPVSIKRKGSDKPLIDTGEMRKSITYKVKKR